MKNLDCLSLRVKDNRLLVLDQTTLPHDENWVQVENVDHMVELIRRLSVRGAPLIGVSAAIALALFPDAFKESEAKLRGSRPTAVNLMNALDRMLDAGPGKATQTAEQIFDEDVELCEKMAAHAAKFLNDGDSVVTHCNTGGLATVGRGTALGAISKAHDDGKRIHVYVDETRPLLQGGRLTTWELEKRGIPYTLICDNMAGILMREGKIQSAWVGADRIAKNHDFANKVGTYSLSVLAKSHGVPFYCVAPHTTQDANCPTGNEIPIEQRADAEVHGYKDLSWSPKGAKTFNPAFDVTPAENLTALITNEGIYS